MDAEDQIHGQMAPKIVVGRGSFQMLVGLGEIPAKNPGHAEHQVGQLKLLCVWVALCHPQELLPGLPSTIGIRGPGGEKSQGSQRQSALRAIGEHGVLGNLVTRVPARVSVPALRGCARKAYGEITASCRSSLSRTRSGESGNPLSNARPQVRWSIASSWAASRAARLPACRWYAAARSAVPAISKCHANRGDKASSSFGAST